MYPRASLTVRFSASLPDQSFTFEEPQLTSVVTLLCQVRDRLPESHAGQRIRLIYAGRALILENSLAEALRLQPDRSSTSTPKPGAKGKAPIKAPPPTDRVYYIHAGFSDALDSAALEKEKKDALAADSALVSASEEEADSSGSQEKKLASTSKAGHGEGNSQREPTGQEGSSTDGPVSPESQIPQGFDRLLSAGLSALEVASLRSQFLAILAHTHTPDTMPNAYELRELEERWLDNDAEGVSPSGGMVAAQEGQGATGGGILSRLGGNVGDEDSSGLDDMLWGNLIGFFWPIGAVVWLMREDGVWTQRRKIAVVTGALVNLAFSIMRAAS